MGIPMARLHVILVRYPTISGGIVLLGFFLLFISCSTSRSTMLQPDKLPYQFQTVFDLPFDNVIVSDLDGNGFTEMIAIDTSLSKGQTGSRLMMYTFEGSIIQQVNYAGKIINTVQTLDYDADGRLEILVPFMRNDSLFVSFVNVNGDKLFYFFLIDGKPRIEDGGSFRWDPEIRSFYIFDLNKDGIKELVTVITTGYARLPRGILVHSLPQGKLIGKKIIGSPPRDNFLDDFNKDGKMEILCFGTAPDNGAIAGGFDDKHSYLIVFDLTPIPTVINSTKISDEFSNYYLFYEDVDGDFQKELIAWTEALSDNFDRSKIMELDPMTFNAINQRPFNVALSSVVPVNLNRDMQLEFIAIQSRKEIVILNHQLDELQRRYFPTTIYGVKTLSDLDNDGIDEIVVNSEAGDFWLDNKLKVKTFFPHLRCWKIVHRGINLAPQILLQGENHFSVVEVVPNRYYFIKRYLEIGLFAIAIGLFLSVAIYIIRLRWRNQVLTGVQSLIFDSDARGILLFDNRQKIHLMNGTLLGWLGIPESDAPGNDSLSEIFSHHPGIVAFFTETLAGPVQRSEKMLLLRLDDHQRRIQVIMEPMSRQKRRSFWLVKFIDTSADDENRQAKTWCQMAQKTAHDIKNLLTTIRLTAERLQIICREQFPPAAKVLDPFVARIIERLDSLRRISKNFMKFINIDTLNFVNTDLNGFLNETTEVIRPGLPPDIQFDFRAGTNLPMVKIDHDAMRSVLENLVSNAINALPEGGKIAISTQFSPGLSVSGNGDGVKDYVLIEVMDTGIGIASADREHLFDPGFTTNENGNGLGLAYVKKTVDDHAGFIEVESESGAGTAFSIYIPTI